MDTIVQVVARNVAALMERSADIRNAVALAKASGVSRTSIYRILDCECATAIDSLEKIAKAFGVPAWTLIHPDGPPRAPSPDRIFATNLRRFMERNALNAAHVSKRTGVNYERISAVLAEKESPTLETVAAVASGYAIPLRDLLSSDFAPPELTSSDSTPRATRRLRRGYNRGRNGNG